MISQRQPASASCCFLKIVEEPNTTAATDLYQVPTMGQVSVQICCSPIIPPKLCKTYSFPHFTDEKTESGGKLTWQSHKLASFKVPFFFFFLNKRKERQLARKLAVAGSF